MRCACESERILVCMFESLCMNVCVCFCVAYVYVCVREFRLECMHVCVYQSARTDDKVRVTRIALSLLSFDRMTLVFVILFQTGLILSVSRYLGFKSFSICRFVFCLFYLGAYFFCFSRKLWFNSLFIFAINA